MHTSSTTTHSVEGQEPDERGQARERLRFVRFSFTRTQTAYCTAEVEVEWAAGERFIGKADGIASPLGDFRLTALATLDALDRFSDGAMHFDLVGVKTLRAFDATVVIVSVSYGQGAARQRLLGCHLSDDDVLRSTVLATLQATNRALGNHVARR